MGGTLGAVRRMECVERIVELRSAYRVTFVVSELTRLGMRQIGRMVPQVLEMGKRLREWRMLRTDSCRRPAAGLAEGIVAMAPLDEAAYALPG
jgi:hypothetical protein